MRVQASATAWACMLPMLTHATSAQVKLLCAQQDYSGAKERVMDSGHKGAAFYLARRLEMLDQPAEAILFYGMAKRYSVGASLARRHGLSQVQTPENSLKYVYLQLSTGIALTRDCAPHARLHEPNAHELNNNAHPLPWQESSAVLVALPRGTVVYSSKDHSVSNCDVTNLADK